MSRIFCAFMAVSAGLFHCSKQQVLKNGQELFCSQREGSTYCFWNDIQRNTDFQRQLLVVCPKVKQAFAYGTLCFGILRIENWDATRRLQRVALSKRLDRYL